MSVQLSYDGLDPFQRIESSALELVGVLHHGKQQVVVFRRIKLVDDTTAKEIIPECSPSLLPIVVNEISTFASNRWMELNHKNCKEMVILFLKYDVARSNPIYVSDLPSSQFLPLNFFVLLYQTTLLGIPTWGKFIKKANSRLCALRQLKKAGQSKTDFVIINCSFVCSVVEYPAPAWSNVIIYLSDSN